MILIIRKWGTFQYMELFDCPPIPCMFSFWFWVNFYLWIGIKWYPSLYDATKTRSRVLLSSLSWNWVEIYYNFAIFCNLSFDPWIPYSDIHQKCDFLGYCFLDPLFLFSLKVLLVGLSFYGSIFIFIFINHILNIL